MTITSHDERTVSVSANADGQQVENYLLFLSLSDTVNEMRAALQQKEAELNLRASEHNAARKQNDENALRARIAVKGKASRNGSSLASKSAEGARI